MASPESSASQSTEALLTSWGLSPTICKRFTAGKVTLPILPLLTDALIKELIPDVGPRTLFLHKLSELKLQQSEPSCSSSNSNGMSSSCPDPTPPKRKRKSDEENFESQLKTLKTQKRVNDLHAYLLTTARGLTVLGTYSINGVLRSGDRDILCDEAILMALADDFDAKLTRKDFSNIADKIVALFPTESKDTWFDIVVKGTRIVLEGRLRFKYYSTRNKFAAAHLISTKACEEAEVDEDLPSSESNVEQLETFQGLKNADDWQEYSRQWEATRAKRLLSLKKPEIHMYFDLYIGIKKALGWKLIASDGISIQESLSNLPTLWDDYSNIIVKIIQEEDKRFVDSGWSESDADEISPNGKVKRFLTILLRMPYLFRVRNVPKSKELSTKQKGWRPSFKEISDGLCIHVKNIGELDDRLKARRKL